MSAALAALPLSFQSADTPRIAFSPDSRQLVVQFALPTVEVIPANRGHRFVKTRAEIVPTPMPASERKRRYAALIAQIALLVVDRSFGCDPDGVIETVVVNGHVATVDKRTGHETNPCLVTVRATRDRFLELDLTRIDPVAAPQHRPSGRTPPANFVGQPLARDVSSSRSPPLLRYKSGIEQAAQVVARRGRRNVCLG